VIFLDTGFLFAFVSEDDANHSFVVMEARGIREAFAFDSDFGHRFILKPGPAR
jgi:predicted nucleic acid-binding protein